jgi:signal transduction histidine kinase
MLGLLLSAPCLLLGALFLASNAVDPELHHVFDQRLERLEAVQTRLNQNVLRARHGMLGHYDDIVDDMAALERLRAGIDTAPRFIDDDGRAEFDAALRAYEEVAHEKTALTEGFKSINAALRNSLVYFPIVANDLLERVSSHAASGLAPMAELHVAVLRYIGSGTESDQQRAWRALDATEASQFDDRETARLAEATRIHARNILVRKPVLDERIDQIIGAPTISRAQALRASYRRGTARAQERAARFGALLYLCSAVLIALVFFSFTALREAKLGLERANEALEQRVRERTLELEDLNQELETSRKEQLALKDRFLSHVSHELRTPLTAVHQFVELLLDGVAGETTPEQHEYLGLAFKNVRQLEAMIHDLMEVTRAQAGKLRVDPRPLELSELLEDTVCAFQAAAHDRSIALSLEAEPELPAVIADATRLRQVLNNLVENALKFTSEGGCITISASREPEEAGFMRVSVADSGKGIAPDEIEKVFDRLHQVDAEGEAARPGLGLGLSICKELVQRQGGRIWVESQLGRGSAFRFTLPAFSISELVRGAVLDQGRLREHFGILRVTLDGTSPTAPGAPAATRRWLREQLTRLALYPTDVVLPDPDADTLFLVAATDRRGMEALRERVRRNLCADEQLSGHSVALDVCVERTSESDRALSPEAGLARVARRIEQRIHDSTAWGSG